MWVLEFLLLFALNPPASNPQSTVLVPCPSVPYTYFNLLVIFGGKLGALSSFSSPQPSKSLPTNLQLQQIHSIRPKHLSPTDSRTCAHSLPQPFSFHILLKNHRGWHTPT